MTPSPPPTTTWASWTRRPGTRCTAVSSWRAARRARPLSRLRGHVEPVFLLISLVFLLYDHVNALLLLQTVVIALGALPVYWLARDAAARSRRARGRPGRRGAALAYLLYPPLEAANLTEFHPVALVPTLVPLCLLLRLAATLAALRPLCPAGHELQGGHVADWWCWGPGLAAGSIWRRRTGTRARHGWAAAVSGGARPRCAVARPGSWSASTSSCRPSAPAATTSSSSATPSWAAARPG